MRLLADFFETALEVFCADSGERLVKVYEELQPNPKGTGEHVGVLPFMKDCMDVANVNLLAGDVRLAERLFRTYGRLKFFRRCFVNNGKDVFLSTEEITSLIGKVFHKMKCLHPVRKTFVLCSTLDEDGTGDRKCPRRFENVDEKHLRQKLIDDGFQCFFSPVDVFGNELPRDVADTEVGAYDIDYCANVTEVKECLAEVTSSARLCLDNTTRHKVFEIFQEMLKTSLEIACSRDYGVATTRIFFGNYDRDGSVSGSAEDEVRAVVGECFDLSVTRIRHVPDVVTEDASAMSLRMYEEVGAFHECLARDVKVGPFRALANTFVNDVMNEVKCALPGGGQTVTCKSIVDAV